MSVEDKKSVLWCDEVLPLHLPLPSPSSTEYQYESYALWSEYTSEVNATQALVSMSEQPVIHSPLVYNPICASECHTPVATRSPTPGARASPDLLKNVQPVPIAPTKKRAVSASTTKKRAFVATKTHKQIHMNKMARRIMVYD